MCIHWQWRGYRWYVFFQTCHILLYPFIFCHVFPGFDSNLILIQSCLTNDQIHLLYPFRSDQHPLSVSNQLLWSNIPIYLWRLFSGTLSLWKDLLLSWLVSSMTAASVTLRTVPLELIQTWPGHSMLKRSNRDWHPPVHFLQGLLNIIFRICSVPWITSVPIPSTPQLQRIWIPTWGTEMGKPSTTVTFRKHDELTFCETFWVQDIMDGFWWCGIPFTTTWQQNEQANIHAWH